MRTKRFHKKFAMNKPRRRFRSTFSLSLLIFAVAVIVFAIFWVRHDYNLYLQPVSNNQTIKLINIPSGSSLSQIASQLKNDGLIRNSLAFEEYVNNQNVRSDLQAGTYALSPSQSVSQIVGILTQGKVATKLVTIVPGARLDQVRASLINSGYAPASVDSALVASQYQNLPVMTFVPSGNSLEGLLYPDSFQKTTGTDPSVIVSESLTEMGEQLTPDLQASFAKEGLSTYQGIILASIIEKEVSSSSDQAKVAQVFLARMAQNMTLQSNVTAYYGCILNNQPLSISYDTPYNTYIHTGLPPTPVSNVDKQALYAAAHPASTNYLYFDTGKDGVTYFAQTNDQQNANIAQYGESSQ
jgi:UPF0755 protein